MIDFIKYAQFVSAVTSQESKDYTSFANRVYELAEEGVPTERLLTASVGLCAESGEFTEIVKKMVFQGKPASEENFYHMKRELGDIMWYFMQACLALDVSPEEIVEMNVEKLKARYPGGEFDVRYSENRQEGDV
ncbi:pyrophosphatase [Cyanophage S-RIM12 isolate W1_08_0910]|uniref:Pyrophosphatase n=4 Tax=Brizovirus TaxID=2733098 RepID=A0A1D7T028_9CAUD|nr:MazG-like pyrophosphatase [Cyanophage S-RIM12 isolate RW_06_0310]YP_009779571.1 MazG-like pyrophosphatase [Cyanophage S-RIM12 isolate W1_08_0910]AOO15434.1 pyrophosphatase [Cyanophage S-RIM12_Np_15_0310]AOO16074.1 pyrophosphatase [Cyanophage S-RIM12_RW_04_0310]AOO18867.1 pyrophosphatase [Cyanophage S-RIM12_W1_12_0610]AOO19294.1 pyrophosphatase [Cyanophage S-RIM12_WH_05_0310]AOO19507.1 pyrophosphatase [Cyanophage S-RIM12_WH_07_0310]